MRFLTSRRRHPLAKPLLLLVVLFALGALYAALAPTPRSSAAPATSEQIQRGQELFAQSCSSCHGMNGEGTSQGPTLQGVGSASVDFQMGTGRMPAVGGGVQNPAKGSIFPQADIDAIGAYVATLGAGPAKPAESQYGYADLSEDEIARGGELFRTNCSACHNFEGSGGALPHGKYAPNLEEVTAPHIYEAMRTGPGQMPVFSKQVVTDQDAREIIGYLKTLNEQPKRGGLTLGGIGPVAEGFWAWVAGIGTLALFATWIAKKGARAR